jgi:hypothetical protein
VRSDAQFSAAGKYGNVGRSPGLRGQTINNMNLTLSKRVKIAERVDMQLAAQVYNVLNRLFLGGPDPSIDDNNFTAALAGKSGGSYGNNYFNNSGGSYTAATIPGGLARRRMILGAKFTF